MPHTTASGVPIPTGTDAFSPTAQFKAWADFAAQYENHLIVALDTDRTALASPVRRDGLVVYVIATKLRWQYRGTVWVALDPAVTTNAIAYSQRGPGATLATVSFPAVGYDTSVDIRFDGLLADGTGTAHSARVAFTASAGTLTTYVDQHFLVPTNQIAAHVVPALLAIPASTAVTLTAASTATSGNTYYQGLLKTVRTAA